MFVHQFCVTALRDPRVGLEILAHCERAYRAEADALRAAASSGRGRDGADSLAARLIAQEALLIMGARLEWILDARSETQAIMRAREHRGSPGAEPEAA